jgi:hypothetical protein
MAGTIHLEDKRRQWNHMYNYSEGTSTVHQEIDETLLEKK